MTRKVRDTLASLLVALGLVLAIAVIWIALIGAAVHANADGLRGLPPAYQPEPPPLFSLPTQGVQGPPSQSCIETAIQLAYQTGSRQVGNAAAAACRYYAPVQFPRSDRYYGPPLGWQPPPG